jgi:hypothetical protein
MTHQSSQFHFPPQLIAHSHVKVTFFQYLVCPPRAPMTSDLGSFAAECLPTLPVTQPRAVVTIAVPVAVLGRVYPIHLKGVLWGSNPVIWMAKEATGMLLLCR